MANVRRNPEIAAIVEEAARWNAEIVSIDVSARHPHVTLRHNGAERLVVCAGSPSDSVCGPDNARANVRRALGVASRPARKGERRPRRQHAGTGHVPASPAAGDGADTRTSLAEALTRLRPLLFQLLSADVKGAHAVGIVIIIAAIIAGWTGLDLYRAHFDPVRIAEAERSTAIVRVRGALIDRTEQIASDTKAVVILADIAKDCENERVANGWFSVADDCSGIRSSLERVEKSAARQARASKFAEIAGAEIVAPLVGEGNGR